MLLPGCASLTPAGFPAELSDAARQISVSTLDQAVWTRLLARLDGQIIEPGMEGYAGVLYVAGGKLRGVSGQLSIEGDGGGSGELSETARAAIVELSTRPDLLAQVLTLIAENKGNHGPPSRVDTESTEAGKPADVSGADGARWEGASAVDSRLRGNDDETPDTGGQAASGTQAGKPADVSQTPADGETATPSTQPSADGE